MRLDWLKSLSLNELPFFFAVALLARCEKLSRYEDLLFLLDVNIVAAVEVVKTKECNAALIESETAKRWVRR